MNPTGLRGKSITPKMLEMIHKDLAETKASKKQIAQKYGLSAGTIRNIDQARKLPTITVKGVVKNI